MDSRLLGGSDRDRTSRCIRPKAHNEPHEKIAHNAIETASILRVSPAATGILFTELEARPQGIHDLAADARGRACKNGVLGKLLGVL